MVGKKSAAKKVFLNGLSNLTRTSSQERISQKCCPNSKIIRIAPPWGSGLVSRRNFTAFSAGANILELQTFSKFKLKSCYHTTSKTPVRVPGNPPITLLVSDLTLGTCWDFTGQRGQVGIQLTCIITTSINGWDWCTRVELGITHPIQTVSSLT
ncbi:hypothetical protein VP01_5375g1 [Puccinia sorghi]|uniref:Uncharacterized protein n=1 Tax=Puccinia sorghi TaxID=27349 RepID=A0A0L6UKR2_9BASI|nr:hypothetical protein VP01_5375g1 [Puccinia sorghi]